MSQIGILGGGQLAMMLEEAAPRGLTLDIMKQGIGRFDCPARLAVPANPRHIENEFVDTHLLKEAAHPGVQFAPSLEAIELIKTNSTKNILKDAGLPVPQFRSCELKTVSIAPATGAGRLS